MLSMITADYVQLLLNLLTMYKPTKNSGRRILLPRLLMCLIHKKIREIEKICIINIFNFEKHILIIGLCTRTFKVLKY